MKKILYVGSSCAYRSYDTMDGTESDYTNLLKELELSAVNLSRRGLSNMECLDLVNQYEGHYDAIIWVYCEVISDCLHEFKQNFIESENFWALRSKMNQKILDMINRLGCPVGLIGGHSDVVDCNQTNITVIHPSWQKFLANQVGVDLEHGWGAEVAHRYAMYEFKKSKPSKAMIDLTSDTLRAWTQMEMSGVWFGVHPNRKGNELFAKEIKSSVQSFINNL
jgi:hypothetical protein